MLSVRMGPLVTGLVVGAVLAFFTVRPRGSVSLSVSMSVSPSLVRVSTSTPTTVSGTSRPLLVCVLLSSSVRYTEAAKATWTRSCSALHSADTGLHSHSHPPLHSARNNPSNTTSSFHLLCDLMRRVATAYPGADWFLFVKDDMFVIPENLERLVARFDPSRGYYLGHGINFWGVDYNAASAGYVLSREALRLIVVRFPDTQSCVSGGKYWKQEDLYLGKHLRPMNIFPIDTRDGDGNSVFFAYDLDKIMFPNSISRFSNFYTRAIYPVKCCGRRTVTFQVLSSTEIYRYYYMIYTLRVYPSVAGDNLEPPAPLSEDYVWHEFLDERGLPYNITNRQYEESWYIKFGNTTVLPGTRNIGDDGALDRFNFTNMPEILAGMLFNYSLNRP